MLVFISFFIRFFESDGKSGKDVSNFIKKIDHKYWYYWGGKNPDDESIKLLSGKMISLISILRYKDYSITYNGRPIRDLGYDCSGLLCAANNANPDISHTFNPAYSGTTYLFNFMSKSSDYIKITNLSDLKEGDFIIRKGVHALIVVKDESGHLVLAEAKESGTKVGTNLRTLESIKNALKKEFMLGFMIQVMIRARQKVCHS